MPYLLTANPGSPTSWVKMDTQNGQQQQQQQQQQQLSCFQQQETQQRLYGTRQSRPLPPIGGNVGPGSKNIPFFNPNYTHMPNSYHPTNGLFGTLNFNGPNGSLGNYSNGLPSSITGLSSTPGYSGLNGPGNGTPPHLQLSPTSVLSNYSLSRNLNHLNLNIAPRTGSVLSNQSGLNHYRQDLDSPPYQTAVSIPNLNSRSHEQESDWGDNTTAVTGLSDLGFPPDAMGRWGEDAGSGASSDTTDLDGWRFICQRYMGCWTLAALSLISFVSPIIMVILPQFDVMGLRENQKKCEVECDGILISFTFKLMILLLGSWALFYRGTHGSRATLPKIHLFRASLAVLLFVLIFAFWLFYGVRIFNEQKRRINYLQVVSYANSMVETLLFVHYLAIILLEIKHLMPQFYIKIVRSPDGESRSYAIGQLSIQRSAVWILEKYYTDFPIYNPYLDRVFSSGKSGNTQNLNRLTTSSSQTGTPCTATKSNYKYFDVDGLGTIQEKDNRMSSPIPNLRKRDTSHNNDRFYEEFDFDRRLKRRKSRLVAATEDAFALVNRINEERMKGSSSRMDSFEAAQSIFPSLARPLQKYLRITRQQPRHTMESILQHLDLCLKYDMAPKAFLEKYLVTAPILQNDREHRPIQTWSLICDTLLSRNIKPGIVFQLRQGDVSLLCEVQALPHFNIIEEVIDPRYNKFTMKLNPETPV